MRSVGCATLLVLGSAVVLVHGAQAQPQPQPQVALEGAATLGAPEPNALIPPLRLPPEPPRRARLGWAAFGAQAGFVLGTIGSAGIIVSSIDDAPPSASGGPSSGDGPPAVAFAALALTVGGAIGGGMLFGALADDGAWDPASGWGAAGTVPGTWFGIALSGGALALVDAHPDAAVSVAVLSLGVIGGAALGYFAWHRIGLEKRTPGWILLTTWAASLLSEIIGIGVASGMEGGSAENSDVMLLTMALGTVFGTGLGVVVFD